jgi:hypothetical protein
LAECERRAAAGRLGFGDGFFGAENADDGDRMMCSG